MINGGSGGANTNANGLKFERKIDIKTAFHGLNGYEVKNNNIYFDDELVARLYQKHDLYKIFCKEHDIKWKEIFSSKLLPDEAIFVVKHNTLYIIEKKFQHKTGSTDEKLQTCDFKKKQYKKLVSKAKIKVEYCYVLNDWFKQKKYKDVFAYIESCGCDYFIEELPFSFLGLPSPKKN